MTQFLSQSNMRWSAFDRRVVLVLSGRLLVRLSSQAFEADTLHGETASLRKLEHNFRGQDFEKQFACVITVGIALQMRWWRK